MCHVTPDTCYEHVKAGKAGADFGAQPASPGPKASLASPTTVGECASQEPALAPSRDVVPGFGGFSSAEECVDGRMALRLAKRDGLPNQDGSYLKLKARVLLTGQYKLVNTMAVTL